MEQPTQHNSNNNNTMTNTIQVTKRDGTLTGLDINKIHKVVMAACDGLAGTSASEIELKSSISFYNKIKTADIQETLIKTAANLITEESPNYQYAAGRLINYHLRKGIYGSYEPPHILDHTKRIIDLGFYDKILLALYSEDEWNQMQNTINHSRDELFTYAAMEQWRGKYLVKNRVTGEIYETPQMAYMLIAAFLFQNYPKETRMKYVKDFYNALSTFQIGLPTPVMAEVRTPRRQFSSCVLIEADDSLDSIFSVAHATGLYVANKAGIGINGGRLRAVGSKIRGGDAFHTGVIPFYRAWQAALKSCSQGSIRGGAGTLYIPIWHLEIEDIMVLKNNKGTEQNRLRQMDYGIQFNKLMYERLISGEHISLFSPNDVPELYEAFFNDQEKFKELYERAEKNTRIRKKKIRAIELFSAFMQERKETGRIYLMNVDHCNSHGSFKESTSPIRQSNLCCLIGSTMVDIASEGGEIRTIPLEDIIKDGTWNNSKAMCFDQQNNTIAWKDITNVMIADKDALVVEVSYGHHSVICTPNHQFFTTNRGYVKAEELKADDKLYGVPVTEGSIVTVTPQEKTQTVYDIEVKDAHNYFANGILVHNCEITLPTKPLRSIDDTEAEIALCILGSVNLGVIKQKEDMQKPCELLVRALDELIDLQHYVVKAAERSTINRRPIGIGINNLAYYLAKNDMNYEGIDLSGRDHLDELFEAWSYYLIKASADLALEKGRCAWNHETKYSDGIVPLDTYKKEVDKLTSRKPSMDWASLRQQLKNTGIRNSTVMAVMPSETNSQILNSTNGIEPVRALVSIKQSKDGVLPQVVPEIRRLKNKYNLLWDQKSPVGYLEIAAILQKWTDQAISVNTSYNPVFYLNNQIPMSELLQDLILCYKYGIKTLYYFNSLDQSGEEDLPGLPRINTEEEACESCAV